MLHACSLEEIENTLEFEEEKVGGREGQVCLGLVGGIGDWRLNLCCLQAV